MAACNKAFPGVGSTTHEFLGAGAVYFNWGLPNETRVGTTKGGSEFNDNGEFREREADGDYMPVKGHRNITKFMPQLTINALRLSTANLIKFQAGAHEDNTTPGTTKIYRTIDLSNSYIDNVAFVGANKEGKFMLIVVDNALADSPFNLPVAAKEEEFVVNVIFTGHADENFCPDDPTTYPWHIERDTSQVTFTVNDDLAAPIENAEIIFDFQYGITDIAGQATFTADKSIKLNYTITAVGFDTLTGSTTVDENTEAVIVAMTPTP